MLQQFFIKLQELPYTTLTHAQYFSTDDIDNMKNYLQAFIDILKGDMDLKESIVEKCRTK